MLKRFLKYEKSHLDFYSEGVFRLAYVDRQIKLMPLVESDYAFTDGPYLF